MPEIKYKSLKNHIQDAQENSFPKVYLIYGDEFLYKAALDDLVNAILPGSQKDIGYEAFNSSEDDIFGIIEILNTFPFMGTKKVVSLDTSSMFEAKNSKNIIDKAKKAFEDNDYAKASNYFLNFLSTSGLTYDDLKNNDTVTADFAIELTLITRLTDYCINNDLKIPKNYNFEKTLQTGLEKGFPEQNYLIIISEKIDKRRTFFKYIKEHGVIVDCSVPTGDRMADKKEQEKVLYEHMDAILKINKKSIEPAAFNEICKITGFDLRTFIFNIEKLIDYIGKAELITIKDVEFLIQRTKQDPIYELTGAISDRNVESAFFYLDSLLSNGFYPLQIIKAITNQVRKLLVFKDFTLSKYGTVWNRSFSFNQFKNSDIISAIISYDNEVVSLIENWQQLLYDKDNKKKHPKKQKINSDVFMAKFFKSEYPVYQTLIKSENFDKNELIYSFEFIADADLQLKTSSQNPKLILENLIMKICIKRDCT